MIVGSGQFKYRLNAEWARLPDGSKVSAVLSAQHWADERAAGFDSPQARL
jgi:hypothetical protein